MAFTRIRGAGIHTAANINSHNINSTGIITAVSFVGDGSGLTGVASTDYIITGTAATFTGGVDINSDLDVDGHTNLDNVSIAGVTTFSGGLTGTTANFSGNVTVGGVLTYEDVKNVDSIGIITARSGLDVDDFLDVGPSIKLGNAGVITATTFKGDGDFVELDVDGQTNLDHVSIAGLTTIAQDLDVDGHTNLDNVSVAGVTTFASSIKLNNQQRINFGNSSSSYIYYDSGGTTHFQTKGGNLSFSSNIGNTFKHLISAIPNNKVSLYYSGVEKIQTTTKGIQVGTGVTIETNGQATFSGIVTASTYYGDGSNLTGITGTTINNNSNNRVITGSGTANTLEGESSFTYDGNGMVDIEGTAAAGIQIKTPNNTDGGVYFRTGSSNPGAVTYQHSDNSMRYRVNSTEKLRIDSDGKLLLGSGSYNNNSNGFKMSIKESSNENAAIMFLDTDNMKGGICGIAKGNDQIITGTTNVDFVLGSVYADTHIIYGTPSNQAGAIGMTLKADTGHIVIEEGLGIGGVDPGGSTLKVNGSLNLSQGGNTSWQKVAIEGSNNTAGDALSINNWGDAEGDYWGLMVNQTMNQSGNFSKTNSGKRTSYITLDGRMGRVYLGGASTSGNPTNHFYTNWDGTVYMNSGFGSVAPFYGVRAWVQGNSGTTNGSGGLSSMSRVSTGKYRLNFATAMPDDNYATGCLANNNYDDTSWHGDTETTSVDVHFYTGSSYVDPSEWSAWVIR